ncbi:MAG: RDD family protein [Candidatus Thermoplasmatota archaeon]
MKKNYSGIGTRAIAQIVDGIIALIIFFTVGSLVSIPFQGFTPTGFYLTGMPAFLFLALSALLLFIYFFILEARRGQTVGKIVTGIKVVREDGSKCDLNSSLIRNILRIVDGIAVYIVGAILIVQSDKNQRLGDRYANTIVVET